MKRLYYLILLGIGSLFSVPAVILIIAYQKGKATADKIKAHMEKSNKKNKR